MGKKRRAQADMKNKAFYGKDGEAKSYRQALDEKKISSHLSGSRRKAARHDDNEEDELDDSAMSLGGVRST